MKLRLLSLLLALLLVLCGCTSGNDGYDRDDDDDEREERHEEDEAPSFTVTEITFETTYADSSEYAVITALDEDGDIVWQNETEYYEIAQLARVSDIGLWEDRYYYVEDGSVVALDRETGDRLWVNADFGGSPADKSGCMICPDGTIYITGYLGPDFMAIDKDGQQLAYISIVHNDYYWPYEVQLEEDLIVITFEGGPEGDGTFYFYVDPNTWEVTE